MSKITQKTKKNYKKKKEKNEIILPLYFGWEVVLRKVDDLKKHIFGPFKEYWQYMTFVFILILIVSTTLLIKNHNEPTEAATYNWAQDTWVGGVDATATATHANLSDRTNWDRYQSASSTLTIGDDISITPQVASTTHTENADFTGTYSGSTSTAGSITLDL